jgi:hypothetical protein
MAKKEKNLSVMPFPSKQIEESKKTADYHKDWAKAIETVYKENRGGISEDDRAWFRLLRQYGSGNQPEDIYKDFKNSNIGLRTDDLDADNRPISKDKGSRVGYPHIDNNNVSLMPRIKNRIKGYVFGIDYDIKIDTIDDNSGAEKESKKNELRVQMQYGEFIKQYKMNAGLPVEEPLYVPQSPQELELYEAINGFKLNSAIAMEKLMNHTFEIARWDEHIRDLVVDDLCDTGYAAVRNVLDNETLRFVPKYIDPEYLIIPYSKNHDFAEMPWVGYYEFLTIAELRMECPDVPEDELYALASNSCGKFNNPESAFWDDYKVRSVDGQYRYDGFLVLVLHAEWVDEEAYAKAEYTSKHGRKTRYVVQSKEERESLKAKDKPNQVIVDYNKRKLRMCSWVVDSEIVYDWGLSNFQDRPSKNKVIPSIRVVKLNDKPITELLYPVMDDFKIAWMKFQDGRAMAIKDGYAIDWQMLLNLEDGDKKWPVLDIIKMWRDSGILMFQGSLEGKYEGGAVKPVTPIQGTGMLMLTEAIQLWNFALQKLQDITGLSPISLGSTNAPQGTTGTATEAQLGVSATVDILKPLVVKLLQLKQDISESIIRKIQLGIRFSNDIRKAYEPVVGKNDMQILEDAEHSAVQYGMSFEAKPDEDYKRAILEAANISLNNRREGRPGIDMATHTYIIERVMQGGNLKELRLIIAYQESKAREEIDMQSKQNIELQGQQNLKLEQAKSQAMQQAQQFELQKEYLNIQKEAIKAYYNFNPQAAEPIVRQFMGSTTSPQGAVSPSSPPSGTQIPPQEEVANMGAM